MLERRQLTARYPALRDEILRRAAHDPSFASHNKGGWRTPPTLFEWPEAATLHADLRALLTIAPSQDLIGWAVVNRNGSFHARHHHLGYGNERSGIYYLDPGPPPSARTYFERINTERIYVEPAPDLVVLFAPDVWHGTERQRGDGPRITIAFDVCRRDASW